MTSTQALSLLCDYNDKHGSLPNVNNYNLWEQQEARDTLPSYRFYKNHPELGGIRKLKPLVSQLSASRTADRLKATERATKASSRPDTIYVSPDGLNAFREPVDGATPVTLYDNEEQLAARKLQIILQRVPAEDRELVQSYLQGKGVSI
jgi:hypothetical protein